MAQTCELPTVRKADGTKRGERWLALSFLFCPCHLPWTLGLLALVFGGTALGSWVRGNGVLVGIAVTALWVAGTAKGFVLIRQAEKAVKLALALDAAADRESATASVGPQE
jgi:mercuric ion transport protein